MRGLSSSGAAELCYHPTTFSRSSSLFRMPYCLVLSFAFPLAHLSPCQLTHSRAPHASLVPVSPCPRVPSTCVPLPPCHLAHLSPKFVPLVTLSPCPRVPSTCVPLSPCHRAHVSPKFVSLVLWILPQNPPQKKRGQTTLRGSDYPRVV
jgi:hypothetical protein